MSGKSLRILVVLPMYGGSLPIGEYCVRALRELGHSVRVFEAQKLFSAYEGLCDMDLTPGRITALTNAFLRFVSQSAWTMAEEQRPELVLALAQAPLDKNCLQKMRQSGMRTVMWFVEDYRVFNYWEMYAPLYDAFAVIQKEPFLSELARLGQKHAFYLPLAADPEIHQPVKLSAAEMREYGADIAFFGAGYPNRRVAFRPLAGRNFKIWGSDWDGESMLAPNIQRAGARIDAAEGVKIGAASKININLHSSISAEKVVSGGDFVNPRTFELAAMGAFQLVDQRGLLNELFADDELATFENETEFYRKIDYYLAHPEEREEYTRKARERVLRNHTYVIRMADLVAHMERYFGPLAKTAPESANGVDADLKEKIKVLIRRLGLWEDTSFDEVIAALRRQTGSLDDLETALLFLDEWRRQYARK